MRIVHTPRDLRGPASPVALVPTMGALHPGHLELIRSARRTARTVVVSVFVNPTQFGPNEDFARYPRDLDRDAALAESAGANVVYAPSVETMYPRTTMAKVVVPEVTEGYEGAHRPGHFEGVATVVLKLLQQVRPDLALFGRKDLQQCAVVRRMVQDLDLGVALEFVETRREADGLAMSSRNVYLSADERAVAPRLHQTLQRIAEEVRNGQPVPDALARGRDRLGDFAVEYLDLVREDTFRPLDRLEDGASVIVAARLGKTRLIDNVRL